MDSLPYELHDEIFDYVFNTGPDYESPCGDYTIARGDSCMIPICRLVCRQWSEWIKPFHASEHANFPELLGFMGYTNIIEYAIKLENMEICVIGALLSNDDICTAVTQLVSNSELMQRLEPYYGYIRRLRNHDDICDYGEEWLQQFDVGGIHKFHLIDESRSTYATKYAIHENTNLSPRDAGKVAKHATDFNRVDLLYKLLEVILFHYKERECYMVHIIGNCTPELTSKILLEHPEEFTEDVCAAIIREAMDAKKMRWHVVNVIMQFAHGRYYHNQ